MITGLIQAPISTTFISEFTQVAMHVFGDQAEQYWLDSLEWRLKRMPDVTVFVAEIDSRLIAFKAGYATSNDRYYSWLGGVLPEFRRRGIAKRLINQQHEWLSGSRFRLLETHVQQDNRAMIQLNLDSGLTIAGFFLRNGSPNFVMQKNI